MRLTKSTVTRLALPPGKKEMIVFDEEMRGFGLRLREGGKKTWIAQYRFGKQQRRVTIGTTATLSLDSARAEAAKILSAVTLGTDPQVAKFTAREAAATTFRSVVQDYLQHTEPKHREAYHADVKRYLEEHWSALASLPLDKITRPTVATHLDRITNERGAFAADRARANLSAFFAWALARGLASTNPVVGTQRPADPKARDRVLSDAELRLVWQHAGEGDFGTIVRLLILTATRRDEVANMRWSEIADNGWTIPAERAKNGEPHELPLPTTAAALVSAVHRRTKRDLIFGEGTGGFSGWSKSKERLDARMLKAMRELDPKAKLPPWRLHDLRRTTATGMAELGVQPHVVEAVLNHRSGHKAGVAGVYNRATYRAEKQAALALWASRIETLIQETKS
jgi:integrase